MPHIFPCSRFCKVFTAAFLALLGLLPTFLAAWSFDPDPICTLSHETDQARFVMTFDPSGPEYRLTITRTHSNWAPSPAFAMIFDGPAPPISTTFHVIEGQNLTVTDRGFGNVLRGLEVSLEAVAATTDQAAVFELDGIAEPLAAFRACPAAATS